MDITRRHWMLAIAGMVLPSFGSAQSASWPSRPIRLLAGGVGGVTDIRARWLGERLGHALGQPVVVENYAGAGGMVGAEQVARSAPDGYTLLLTHQGIATINPHLYARVGYDPLKDFAPVTRFGYGSLLLAVPASLPVSNVAELIQFAKANPGKLNYGSPGIGTPPHLASELFRRMAGIDVTHVPYKGGGALLAALLGGQITWSMDGLTVQVPHVRSGRLRALGVTGTQRASVLPDVPTIAQAGLPGYEFSGWTGIAAPAGTPQPVIARLYAEITRISASSEAREWFAANGAEPGALSPDAFGDYIRSEYVRWGKVIHDAGIKAE
ncbi:tripartite tricarboxylate transporter substrate binding protein [Cupriavidus basilensis]|uniref:Tripartite tricarboxylate transporter substrate binding protein n=1 Tax=Cupriavidus basilensis TaxID=68895 RepID=A0ABT6AY91_9BURK|nr:tripartite tricarboxylate transporter substrate binding protein [Cupriavidus basilensis]MDF3837595.1 tripartite tricarboxylate transporter substrate binding protein [Cupriavidus basilensis]